MLFYISKTDAWNDNVGLGKGLLKLGRIRVSFAPNPLGGGTAFKQTLRLGDGEIVVLAGPADAAVATHVWVDANRSVVHIEAVGSKPTALTVRFESLRPIADKTVHADTIVDGHKNRVAWCYRNQNKQVSRLTNVTFGAVVRGDGLVSENSTTLRSERPANRQEFCIYPRTAQTATVDEWLALVERQIVEADAVPLDTARREHRDWWRQFWNRSWIFADGSDDARKVTQGYVLQRYVSACAGRGAYPIKFNGSIFTMDWHKHERVKGVAKDTLLSADERDWGGQYWFQNTRPMYWPMLQSGDFEMMRPLFCMYQDQLPGNAKAVHEFYGHDGAYFAETNPFYGSLPNIKPSEAGSYTKHYFTPILELDRDDARLLRLYGRPRVCATNTPAGRRRRLDVLRPAFQARKWQAGA